MRPGLASPSPESQGDSPLEPPRTARQNAGPDPRADLGRLLRSRPPSPSRHFHLVGKGSNSIRSFERFHLENPSQRGELAVGRSSGTPAQFLIGASPLAVADAVKPDVPYSTSTS